MPRHRPDEDTVRRQMRARDEEVEAPAREEPAPDGRPADEPAGSAAGEPDGADDGAEPDDAAERAVDAATVAEPEPEEDELTRAQRERGEYLELAQRTRAELDNFRKRAARETAQAGERAKASLVRELLPVVDNLERALASAGEGEQHLADGVRMVHGQLVAALEREGIVSFDPSGDSFDPALHEALSTREQEGSDSGVVLDVVEKGYSLNGSVLRPARVVVSA